jgi:predicted nucleic acid-binding protein
VSATFFDTSGILALVVPSDAQHQPAVAAMAVVQSRRVDRVTTSYVLLETYSLLGRRFGLGAITRLRQDFAPLLQCCWVDESLHEAGMDYLLSQRRRRLSLVDSVSFVFMRRHRIEEAIAFDADFDREGFALPA